MILRHLINARRCLGLRFSSTSNICGASQVSPSKLIPYFEGCSENTISIDLDTWDTVQRLNQAGLPIRQSEIITELLVWILRVRLNEFKRSLVSSSQAEYDLSLMVESFDDLQSSLSAVASRDSVEIRGLADKYQSEISRLMEGMRDGMGLARTDLAITLNGFKADVLEENQRMGMRLHQEESRLAVRMGGFKTDTENVKLKAIYSFSVVLCIAGILVAAKAKSPKATKNKILLE